MNKPFVIPAQIRAGRVFLDWSQEQLAKAAKVGISSVRDIESQKRPADSGATTAIRLALENAGLIFVQGDKEGGPGVRLTANRPNLVRRPTVVTMWDGVPFDIEYQGRRLTAFVSTEALEDLAELTEYSEEQLLESFENNKGLILDAAVRAIEAGNSLDKQGRLHIKGEHFPSLN